MTRQNQHVGNNVKRFCDRNNKMKLLEDVLKKRSERWIWHSHASVKLLLKPESKGHNKSRNADRLWQSFVANPHAKNLHVFVPAITDLNPLAIDPTQGIVANRSFFFVE